MQTPVIAIINRKGGVGKSVSTVNIAANLAAEGHKVLVVDTDSQASASFYLNISDPQDTFYNAMSDDSFSTPLTVFSSRDNLDVIPATPILDACETELVNKIGRERFLADLLKPIQSNYQYILLDCRPAVSLLTVNALCAASHYIIPIKPDLDSLRGILELENNAIRAIRRANPSLTLLGVIAVNVNSSRAIECDSIQEVRQNYPLIEPPIRQDVKMLESFAHKLPISIFNRSSRAAQDYEELTRNIQSKLTLWNPKA